jgi:hypothetical protein
MKQMKIGPLLSGSSSVNPHPRRLRGFGFPALAACVVFAGLILAGCTGPRPVSVEPGRPLKILLISDCNLVSLPSPEFADVGAAREFVSKISSAREGACPPPRRLGDGHVHGGLRPQSEGKNACASR